LTNHLGVLNIINLYLNWWTTMSVDNDCTLWTLGHFSGLTPDRVADLTNTMHGPALDENRVTEMIQILGLGDGRYERFYALGEVQNYMRSAMTEMFAFAWYVPNLEIGHMVCAIRHQDGTIVCQDYQNNGAITFPPGNGIIYYVWQIFRN
jgi:hypothetical protein